MATLTASQCRTMQAGVIQNFEFAYELSWKMLRRQLKEEEGAQEVSALSRKDIFRLAAKKNILDNPEAWFVFHQARNETSHTYNEKTAQAVYATALLFLPCAQTLLEQLEKR